MTAQKHPNDSLHRLTLETMLRRLVNWCGRTGLPKRIRINCLKNEPAIPSVLSFLSKTP